MPIPILAVVWRFLRSTWALLKDPETRGLVYLVVIVLVSGMIFYHAVEGWGWLDSLYFSVTTLTTVGFGDFAPKTDAGKAFTIVYILVGLGILAGFINLVAQKNQEAAARLRERRAARHAAESDQPDAPEDKAES